MRCPERVWFVHLGRVESCEKDAGHSGPHGPKPESRIPSDEEAAILLDLQTPFWRQFMAEADWDDE